jgi:hypothetical protein
MIIRLLSVFALMLAVGSAPAHAKKKCHCLWMKDPTLSNYQPGVNFIQQHYSVKEWNELTITNRLPACITECKNHLAANAALVKTRICENNTLYPPVAANSTVKYRLGVRGAVDRPLLNLNIQDQPVYSYSNYITKKVGQPCGY